MATLPMFPLGQVLMPGCYLPLHVFEERYRQLVRSCLEGDREFGVVLIERGSEVGGGDTRTSVGTVARIIEAAELPDGRWAVGAIGTRRVWVTRWLADDPYPRAEVEDWDEPTPGDGLAPAVAEMLGHLRRVLAVAAELGDAATPATIELSDDPVLVSYQASAVAPFGPSDQLALLTVPSAAERVLRLQQLLVEESTFLDQRMALDAAEPDDRPPDDHAPDPD